MILIWEDSLWKNSKLTLYRLIKPLFFFTKLSTMLLQLKVYWEQAMAIPLSESKLSLIAKHLQIKKLNSDQQKKPPKMFLPRTFHLKPLESEG
jgi:hypothetical protein